MHEPETPQPESEATLVRRTPARVIVLEDHPVEHKGLVQIIRSSPGFEVPNRQIALQFGISVRTVETHRENLKVKLGIPDAARLAHAAQDFASSLSD